MVKIELKSRAMLALVNCGLRPLCTKRKAISQQRHLHWDMYLFSLSNLNALIFVTTVDQLFCFSNFSPQVRASQPDALLELQPVSLICMCSQCDTKKVRLHCIVPLDQHWTHGQRASDQGLGSCVWSKLYPAQNLQYMGKCGQGGP